MLETLIRIGKFKCLNNLQQVGFGEGEVDCIECLAGIDEQLCLGPVKLQRFRVGLLMPPNEWPAFRRRNTHSDHARRRVAFCLQHQICR